MDLQLLNFQKTLDLDNYFAKVSDNDDELKNTIIKISLQQHKTNLFCKRACAFIITKYIGILSERSLKNNFFILPDVVYYLSDNPTSSYDEVMNLFSDYHKKFIRNKAYDEKLIIQNAFSSFDGLVESENKSENEEETNEHVNESTSEDEEKLSSEEDEKPSSEEDEKLSSEEDEKPSSEEDEKPSSEEDNYFKNKNLYDDLD